MSKARTNKIKTTRKDKALFASSFRALSDVSQELKIKSELKRKFSAMMNGGYFNE